MNHVLLSASPGLIARWAKLYSDSKSVSATVTFAHLGGVLLGGGFAIVADRSSLRLAPAGSGERARELRELAAVHPWVLWGLGITFATGLLQLFADLTTFLPSAVFWTKMSLVALLLGNGYVRMRTERTLIAGGAGAERRFRGTSIVSLVLWFAILLAGTMLTTVS
ncbi:MAG TPA: hypothetical protein VGI83_08215 [Gemmatimonadales bacterium]|jgi:hypothetical protein